MTEADKPHIHVWIDPTEPPIMRAPYSPIVGVGGHEMKPGHRYQCRYCGKELEIQPEEE